MTIDNKRVMVSVSPELEQKLDIIKKKWFYNKPYSEVFRYIFSRGLKAAREAETEGTTPQKSVSHKEF